MPEQKGKYVLVKCKICDEFFPAHFRGAKQAKYCAGCKKIAYYHPGQDEATKRARREAKRRQSTLRVRLAQYDALAPKPKIEVIERGRVRIERRGVVPAGGRAVAVVPHN